MASSTRGISSHGRDCKAWYGCSSYFVLTGPLLTRFCIRGDNQVDKYEQGIFGACPRVYCNGTHVVPCGRTDLPGLDTVKLYCPNCNDIYTPPSSRFQGVDGEKISPRMPVNAVFSLYIHRLFIGAFFGTTFAHLFFQSYREMMPAPFYKPSASSPRSGSTSNAPSPPFTNPNPYGGQKRAAGKIYTPKIYGFKVSERAKCGPRMQWMRLRPQDPAELDMVDWRGRWYEDEDGEEYEDSEEGGEDRPMEDFDVRTLSHALPILRVCCAD